jgi:alpha-D-ribose 1-methylphosphonate 5-triphosphate synthase subunit PhnI
MYVATKGGETAITNAHRLLDQRRQPRPGSTKLTVEQIVDQQWIGVSRVMTEGSVYDPELAALSLIQSHGDVVEAIFLVRAYRTTLPRLAISHPVDTGRMSVDRRISAAFKDVPGGQILGPTFDYSHRLIAFDESINETSDSIRTLRVVDAEVNDGANHVPRVLDVLDREGLIEPASTNAIDSAGPGSPTHQGDPDQANTSGGLANDLTREPLRFPTPRPVRLQALARGDEGFLLGLAYSTQRGYGSTHPFAGEIRIGGVEVLITPDELDFPIVIGEIEVTECEMINQFQGNDFAPPQFTRGYGLAFGQAERKTMSMALVDRALRAGELGEPVSEDSPAQDTEFVLSHADNVEASGFVQHLKLPHYVDFQAELVLVRDLRDDWDKANQNRTSEATERLPVAAAREVDELATSENGPLNGQQPNQHDQHDQTVNAQAIKVGV